jgi:hypothetical protein
LLLVFAAVQELGATVQQRRADYVYATWSTTGLAGSSAGTVDLEFLFAENDNTVRLIGHKMPCFADDASYASTQK